MIISSVIKKKKRKKKKKKKTIARGPDAWVLSLSWCVVVVMVEAGRQEGPLSCDKGLH